MIQDPNVERLIAKSIEPLNKQISMLKNELESVKKQLAIPRVAGNACKCGRMNKCGERAGLCPKTGIWHT